MTDKQLGWYAAARAILSPQEISVAAALRAVQADAKAKKTGEPAKKDSHMLK